MMSSPNAEQGMFTSPTVGAASLHNPSCPLHNAAGGRKCFGTLRRGGKCKKDATSFRPGLLPMCKLHEVQDKIAGRCQAVQECGFRCNALFEWVPHSFRLCALHSDSSRPCYFLDLPTEIRLRIYDLLLPNRLIPSIPSVAFPLRSDRSHVFTAIMRANRQIHEEVADVLYGQTTFTIEYAGRRFEMCGPNRDHDPTPVYKGTLLSYQTQLMLLEQANKARLIRRLSNYIDPKPERPTGQDLESDNASDEFGSIWKPYLNDTYFQKIRAFQIDITFTGNIVSQTNGLHSWMQYSTAYPNPEQLTERLYEYCDSLHELVGRLMHHRSRIQALNVRVRICGAYYNPSNAANAVKILLGPFQRLRKISNPRVVSITNQDLQNTESYLLESDEEISNYVASWKEKLRREEMASESAVFIAYWRVSKVLKNLDKSKYWVEPQIGKLQRLQLSAKIARESDDMEALQIVWAEVLSMWNEYTTNQSHFDQKIEDFINFTSTFF